MSKKKEIFISVLVLILPLVLFVFAIKYRNSHSDPGFLTCRFENVDSSDRISINIKSNYFDAAVLRSSVPPPSLSVDLRNFVPGTLVVNYENFLRDEKKITIIISIKGEQVEKRELIPSSRMVIPLE
ncbi:hypothetical protein JXA84_05900 [candidate division WOR-3 bacterium]|nr:hypothetical protein [candidate division WOR-3 bacterium]